MKTETELNEYKEQWRTYILENVDAKSEFVAFIRDDKTFSGNYQTGSGKFQTKLSDHQLSYLMGVWDSLLKALE